MSRPGRASAQPIIIKPSRTAADSSKGASALSLAVTEPINGKLTNAVGHEGTLRQPAPLLIKRINIGGKTYALAHGSTHAPTPTRPHAHALSHARIHIHTSTHTLLHTYFRIYIPRHTQTHTYIHSFIDPLLSINLKHNVVVFVEPPCNAQVFRKKMVE